MNDLWLPFFWISFYRTERRESVCRLLANLYRLIGIISLLRRFGQCRSGSPATDRLDWNRFVKTRLACRIRLTARWIPSILSTRYPKCKTN